MPGRGHDATRERGQGGARWRRAGGEAENLLVYVGGYAQLVDDPRIPAMTRIRTRMTGWRGFAVFSGATPETATGIVSAGSNFDWIPIVLRRPNVAQHTLSKPTCAILRGTRRAKFDHRHFCQEF